MSVVDRLAAMRQCRRRRPSLVSSPTGGIVNVKRSPLEQAIAEKTDRRVRYERSMREQGFRKTSLWIKEDCIDDVRTAVRILNDCNGDHRKALQALIAEWTRK